MTKNSTIFKQQLLRIVFIFIAEKPYLWLYCPDECPSGIVLFLMGVLGFFSAITNNAYNSGA